MWHFVFSAPEAADSPLGETQMLQNKLFGQRLLFEEKWPFSHVGNPT